MFVLLTQMNFRTLVVLDCMMHYMILLLYAFGTVRWRPKINRYTLRTFTVYI